MEDPSQSMIFKILNGPQNGVEVALEDGEYSIGSSREDDLQITDVALGGQHGRLRISDGRISISAGNGAITTSTGLSLSAGETGWHDIDQLDVVSLGTTRIAIGKASANWAGLLASSSVDLSGEKPVRAERWPTVTPSIFLRYGLPSVVVLVLAAFVTIGLSSPQSSISGLIKRNGGSDVEVVRGAIAKLPFGQQVKVNEEVDGSIFASGYVDSLVQRRAVNEAVAATGVQVRMRLWAREVVRNEVASLIDVKQLPLTFDMTKDGQIVLKGRELDKTKVDELSALISQQVVGVAGVKSEVETAETVLTNVREIARRAKVGEGVLFRLAPLDGGGQLIEATGAIRNDQIDAWLGFLKSYATSIADIMALRSYVGIEGQTIVVNNAAPAAPGDKTKPGSPAAVPIILASDKAGAGAVGRHVPLDMFLNNQTSYEKLLNAVAPTSKPATAPETAKAPPPVDGKADSPDQAVAAGDEKPVDGTPAATESKAPATPAKAKTPDVSLMQALGVGAVPDLLGGDDDAAIVTPPLVVKPPAIQVASAAGQPAPATQAGAPATSSQKLSDDGRVVSPSSQAQTADGGNAQTAEREVAAADGPINPVNAPDASQPFVPADAASAPKVRTNPTPETAEAAPSGRKRPSGDEKAASPPEDVALSAQSQDQQRAVRQLRDATTAILELSKTSRLEQMLGPERGKDVQSALDRISGDVKDVAALQPLAADPLIRQSFEACWPGSNVTPSILPTLIFWLDLLSVSNKVSIDDLFIDNYGLLLEAGLSPDRVRDCLLRQGDPVMAKLAGSSIYLEEVARNPDFIQFLLRTSPKFNLALAGANTIGARYIQLENGDTLMEGAAPSLESRIASIGDLGVLVRVPKGYVAEVYPKSMPWMIR